MTSRDPQRCCEAVRSAILATAWLLVCREQAYIWDWCHRCGLRDKSDSIDRSSTVDKRPYDGCAIFYDSLTRQG